MATYSNGTLNYKKWQTECIDLSQYIGQSLTIYFATANCTLSGHFAYAYIDGLCKSNNPIPNIVTPTTVCNISDPIIVSGSSTQAENDYYWSINETNSDGSSIVPNTTVATPITYNHPVESINVRSTYNAAGKTIQTGKYYRITLYVRNCGGSWVSTQKVIYVSLPNLITSNNTIICCGSSTTLTAKIGKGLQYPVTNFKWYDENGTFIGNGLMQTTASPFGGYFYTNTFIVTPNKSTKYRIVFEDGGCKNEKWIYVTTYYAGNNPYTAKNLLFTFSTSFCQFPRYVAVKPRYFLNCDGTNNISDFAYHDSMAKASISYLWSTGATTPYIYANANTNYWLKVATPCGAIDTAKFSFYNFTGTLPNLLIANAATLTNPWIAYHSGLAINAKPAYNAYRYRLRIFNRFGNLVYEQDISTYYAFSNGVIRWNGFDMNGNVVEQGVYNYEIVLYNCSGSRQYTGDITFVH